MSQHEHSHDHRDAAPHEPHGGPGQGAQQEPGHGRDARNGPDTGDRSVHDVGHGYDAEQGHEVGDGNRDGHRAGAGPGHGHAYGAESGHGHGHAAPEVHTHGHGAGHGHGHGAPEGHTHGHGAGHGHGDDQDLAEMLDVDAQVMAPVLDALVEQVAEQAGAGTGRVVDLGAGTGVGTVALAKRLPVAEVVAVDRAPAMLERVLAAARAAGVGDRVRVLEADLGEGWPDTGPVDLVWASSSLHELPDVASVLGGAVGVLTPQGSVAVVEMDTLPRFLPDDLGRGRPGLETRCHEVLARAGWNAYQDWTPYLEAVGLDVVRHRHVLRVQPPVELLTRYARAFLQRIRGYVGPHLPAEDVAVLDVLLGSGPESLESRRDLLLQASRTLWLATRPPVSRG